MARSSTITVDAMPSHVQLHTELCGGLIDLVEWTEPDLFGGERLRFTYQCQRCHRHWPEGKAAAK